jgi:hypothetical protein
MGCGRSDIAASGSVGPFSAVRGELAGRPVFVVMAMLGAEGGHLLPCCSDCFVRAAKMLGDGRKR